MTVVKICGITNLEDALTCIECGADALGFNFYPASKRYIPPIEARDIIAELPDHIQKVGVFVNENSATVAKLALRIGLDMVQLHGDETNDHVLETRQRSGLPVIRAYRLKAGESIERNGVSADFILLDAYSDAEYGGTGQEMHRETARSVITQLPNTFLAGGMSSGNVRSYVSDLQPYGVDACSRLEISPGRKNHAEVENFIKEVRAAG
jgi:phosphoribosylanthranilate isomerase